MSLYDRIIFYLHTVVLYRVVKFYDYWFKFDEDLVSVFIERWRLKTHTFYIPFVECTVTLQDENQHKYDFKSYLMNFLLINIFTSTLSIRFGSSRDL
ncbi:hypothetical protein Ahy_B02g057737 [Arachis hypogaea]|uniref:Uncharacterized protein n=1 Tax=Arachis hypogaea TaxID=3818 RepID=A0A445AD08_ARAHY|nr:hypothetical protein Ahy_B02g057737 [Arachis hypogaea]